MTFNEHLIQHLRKKRMMTYELADKLKVSYNELTDATHANKMTDNLATKLGKFFNTTDMYWKLLHKDSEKVEEYSAPMNIERLV